MKQSKFSEYENYLLMAAKSKLSMTYVAFLGFQKTVSFIKEIASKTGDTFLHNGTIYKKKITSNDATKLLDGFLSNRCTDVYQLKSVANQLKIRI